MWKLPQRGIWQNCSVQGLPGVKLVLHNVPKAPAQPLCHTTAVQRQRTGAAAAAGD